MRWRRKKMYMWRLKRELKKTPAIQQIYLERCNTLHFFHIFLHSLVCVQLYNVQPSHMVTMTTSKIDQSKMYSRRARVMHEHTHIYRYTREHRRARATEWEFIVLLKKINKNYIHDHTKKSNRYEIKTHKWKRIKIKRTNGFLHFNWNFQLLRYVYERARVSCDYILSFIVREAIFC